MDRIRSEAKSHRSEIGLAYGCVVELDVYDIARLVSGTLSRILGLYIRARLLL